MKLLYAEDEKYMAEAVTDVLVYNNYLVDVAHDGEDALEMALNNQYDGIILDIMMPKLDGIEVLKRLREHNINTPVIFLTAKSEVEDKVKGLDLGADDYLAKPFSMNELLARIRALLRRKSEYIPSVIEFKDLKLDSSSFRLTSKDGEVLLSNIEYQLMELLLMNKETYLSSEAIFIRIWGYDSDADIGIVWVYISNLRKHLKQIGSETNLVAKRNIGYRIE